MNEHMDHMMPGMMPDGLDLGLAFMAGVLGSGHCVGMCGALVSGFFVNAGKEDIGYAPYFAYHLARISVYAMVGVVVASFGFVLVSTGLTGKIQGVLQIAIGLAVIVLALGIVGLIPWQGSFRFLPVTLLRRGFAYASRRGPILGSAMGGLLNGLMPCPLTFAMAVKATSASTPLEGGLTMLVFGAGTLPTMLFVSIAFGKIGVKFRGTMMKAAAAIMIVMGINTVYKGISFLSEGSFKHRNFFHMVKEWVSDAIVFLGKFVDYLAGLVDNLQYQLLF